MGERFGLLALMVHGAADDDTWGFGVNPHLRAYTALGKR